MEINELNKKQLVLLTLLITFVVSIATGIVTVSLMQQMPKSVPQTINNVIQKTIERVTTVEVPVVNENDTTSNSNNVFFGDNNVVVPIYALDKLETQPIVEIPTDEEVVSPEDASLKENQDNVNNDNVEVKPTEIKALGEGIIISDVGLILVESKILNGYQRYKTVLDKKDFEVSVLKRFENGFTVLKILTKQDIKDKEDNSPENTNF
jgi:hypothetical protein